MAGYFCVEEVGEFDPADPVDPVDPSICILSAPDIVKWIISRNRIDINTRVTPYIKLFKSA